MRNSSASQSRRKGRPPHKKGRGRRSDAVDEDDGSDIYDDDDQSEVSAKERKRNKKAKQMPASACWDPNVESEIDEEGETKVDKTGHLLGGREYNRIIKTFELPSGDETYPNSSKGLLMLSVNVVTVLSENKYPKEKIRDSFVLIKKNPTLVKVDLTGEEKDYLLENSLLPVRFRSRDMSVVTARSIFKRFGHKVVEGGRRGRDDYTNTGEVDDNLHDSQEEDTKDDEKPPLTWTDDTISGRNNLTSQLNTRLDMDPVNDTNWLHHAALTICDFNAQIKEYRRNNPSFYDSHTNVHQIPFAKQSLRAPVNNKMAHAAAPVARMNPPPSTPQSSFS